MAKPKNNRIATSNKMKKEEAARKAVAKEQRKLAEVRARERQLARSEAGERTLRAARTIGKDPIAALDAIENKSLKSTQISKTSPLYPMCSVYESVLEHPKTFPVNIESLRELLIHCFKNTDLFTGRDALKYCTGLSAVVSHREHWLRPLTEWKPTSHNAWRQFNSLVNHLFAIYPVPAFMNTAWYEGFTSVGRSHQQYYIHVGSGKNIRTAENLPIPLTKKMAHHFLQAPSDFNIIEAFRWAQVIDMGGDERLVRSILSTRLSASVGLTDEFWVSCVRWLILNPMLDPEHHGPILDFIHNQKYVPSIPNLSDDWREPRLVPPQPNFSMKGRNPETLLRLIADWHRRLGREAKKGGMESHWNSSGFVNFEHEEGEGTNKKVYTITELLSTKELRDEGNAMKHCVGSYSSSCSRGASSIWSLKRYDMANIERLVTIEVNNTNKVITQVRGKYNALPSAREINILYRWSLVGGPAMSKWIAR